MTRNPEIGNTLSEFCTVSGEWSKLEILNLAKKKFLIKWYLMLQNTRVYCFWLCKFLSFWVSTFYCFWVIKGKPCPPGQIRVNIIYRQLLWHCLTIKIIYIPIFKIWRFFIFNRIFHVFVISFRISMNSMTYSSSDTFFYY